MRTKAGFLVVLSGMFLLSACAEVQSNIQVFNKTRNRLVGQWVYMGFANIQGCSGVVNGVMEIQQNGSVHFIEGKVTPCLTGGYHWFTNEGKGTVSIFFKNNKVFIGEAIDTPTGFQNVSVSFIAGHKHPRFLRFYAPLPGGMIKAVAIHL